MVLTFRLRRLDFNPRSPHGERHVAGSQKKTLHIFQSTLPARGATLKGIEGSEYEYIFQSTLPARGATNVEGHELLITRFQSTLPARGATTTDCLSMTTSRFQSTLPARGATLSICPVCNAVIFQSTLPARGATAIQKDKAFCIDISIHAPRTGSDNFA